MKNKDFENLTVYGDTHTITFWRLFFPLIIDFLEIFGDKFSDYYIYIHIINILLYVSENVFTQLSLMTCMRDGDK